MADLRRAGDDLDEVVAMLRAAPRPLLLGLDIDGTLSPIVAHADQARLVDGVLDSLAALVGRDDLRIVLVTGRSATDARTTFGLPAWLVVVGSHGREIPGDDTGPADADGEPLSALVARAERLAAGVPGAWVERKPFSVTVHVRQADPAAAAVVLAQFDADAVAAGATVLHGSAVVEAGFGPLDKGAAVERLRVEWGAASVSFVGDDVTDERVFARLTGDDVAVKVGSADETEASQAPWRLAGPDRVAELLVALTKG